MGKFFKKIYYSIICYDPIIETLYKKKETADTKSMQTITYVASPIIINRKKKRKFVFEGQHTVLEDDKKRVQKKN